MVGLLYLPIIDVYHARISRDSEAYKIFQLMEYRLLKIIMNPAMIMTFILSLINAHI